MTPTEKLTQELASLKNKQFLSDFFENYIGNIQWTVLVTNKNISYTFFEKHFDEDRRRSRGRFWYRSDIPDHFFVKYADMINWYALVKNPSIPFSFLKENFDKINWKIVLSDFHDLYKNYKLNMRSMDESKRIQLLQEYLALIRIDENKRLAKKIRKSFPFDVKRFRKHHCKLSYISPYYFSQHIGKLNISDWWNLCKNDFSDYIDTRIDEIEFKLKNQFVLDDIKSHVYSVPPNVFGPLRKGGSGYLEVCLKYNTENI